MENLKLLGSEDVIAKLRALPWSHYENYLAMYSSVIGGVTRDPRLMMVPIDDHMVHRGDGVFEAIKCVRRQVYGLEPHLRRLEKSAGLIELRLPFTLGEISRIVCQTIALSGADDCLVRLYLSRGPGGFSPDPYESVGSQLYVVITRLKEPAAEKIAQGVRLITSNIAVKPDFFATIKSCNYLPNVLMKKEAVDHRVDFSVSIDSDGHLAEGATENIGIITADGRLLVPRFQRTLQGVTVSRALDLVRQNLLKSGELKGAELGDITVAQARAAREVAMFGTTIDVLPVVAWDGHAVADGRPGPWVKKIRELLCADILAGKFSTEVTKS